MIINVDISLKDSVRAYYSGLLILAPLVVSFYFTLLFLPDYCHIPPNLDSSITFHVGVASIICCINIKFSYIPVVYSHYRRGLYEQRSGGRHVLRLLSHCIGDPYIL